MRDAETRSASERAAPIPAEIACLAELATLGDLASAVKFISTFVDSGVSAESTLLLLVAPAAGLLGDQWLEEKRAFAEVMRGLDVIRQIVDAMKVSPNR